MVSRPLVVVSLVALISPAVLAQGRVGPVYPTNKPEVQTTGRNYDPFIFDWGSGRWHYAPVPYDTTTGPYSFNWYSGRWDYTPGGFQPSGPGNARPPERMGGDNGQTGIAGAMPWHYPSLEQAAPASATMGPAEPAAQINRPASLITRSSFNYTTADPNFDSWYRSPSK